jgi:aminocarboxymuconate-semialdehyde decarboxylase
VAIDVHAHFVPAGFLDALLAERKLFPSVQVLGEAGAVRMAFAGNQPTRPVSPKLSDLGARKSWLAKNGIERQLVGGWMDLFGYELPPEEGADWCRFANQHLMTGAAGLDSLTPLACVPLQNGKLAAKIMGEALDAGFKGAMIGTQPKGMGGTLDDPELDPFWQLCSDRKASLFLHPMFVCGDDRLGAYDLVNAVGRLNDTNVAVARLLFSGHLTRYPGVNLLLSHGGGALPFALGRLQRNHTISQGKVADPIEGFRRLYFDTVLFDPRALRYLVDMVGAERVMLGSDHPFPIGDDEPVKVVENTPLTRAEREAILATNAARIFSIPCSCSAAH